MTVTKAGWVWVLQRWHLSLMQGVTLCGQRFGYPMRGDPSAPHCERCAKAATRRGIEV